jgi:hypothetical protein
MREQREHTARHEVPRGVAARVDEQQEEEVELEVRGRSPSISAWSSTLAMSSPGRARLLARTPSA